VAQVVQNSLSQIGIKTNISTLGASAFFDQVGSFKSQSFLLLDGAPLNDPAYLLGYLVKCGQLFNWPQYCDSKVDQLLNKGLVETNPSARAAAYKQISQIVEQQAGLVPIFAPDQVIVADPNLSGYVQYPDGEAVFWPISTG
jgi:peptide/nickel transport system substrate-binding protein